MLSSSRFVVFASAADNLVPDDTNFAVDVFLRDLASTTTECISVDRNGEPSNGDSGWGASISFDGRHVAFESLASDLITLDTNGAQDVFVRDRVAGSTQRVSVSSFGGQATGASSQPSISHDGRYVAFACAASDLVQPDTNASDDIFVHDRTTMTTVVASVDSAGTLANGFSGAPSLSGDGRYVVFYSLANNLVPSDTNGVGDVFVHDLTNATTERVSVGSGGSQGNNLSGACGISADGRYVVFESAASNLVAADSNGANDIFLRDRVLGTTERLSRNAMGVQGDSSSRFPSISGDGRYVAHQSHATNLVPNDTNAFADVFVHDRISGSIVRASVDPVGREANHLSGFPSISLDGRYVAFLTASSNVVFLDENDASDVVVRRLR